MATQDISTREIRHKPGIGSRVGKLLITHQAPDKVVVWGGRTKIQKRWLCQCDCGAVTEVPDMNFRRAGRETGSCGCALAGRKLPRDINPDANIRKPEWRTLQTMKTRCYNKKRRDYEWYGAKGVTICDRWLDSFDAFLADMGPKPTPAHTIDRYPNPKGNYEPGNCRWATMADQASSRNPPRKRTNAQAPSSVGNADGPVGVHD